MLINKRLPLWATLLVFFCLPALLGLTYTFHKLGQLERDFLQTESTHVKLITDLLSHAMTPAIEQGKIPELPKRENLRFTLIDPQGRVLADTHADIKHMDNHANRSEIKAALQGTPTGAVRYSQTLDSVNFNFAYPIPTDRGAYVLRSTLSEELLLAPIHTTRVLLGVALAVGVLACVGLIIYGVFRFRPLIRSLRHKDRKLDTLHRRLASELQEQRRLFNAMSEAILLLDSDGNLLQANPTAKRLLHIGTPFSLTRCAIPGLVEAIGKHQDFHKEFNRGNETLLIRGIQLSEGRTLITIADLTALKHLETFRSDFIANLTHEIRTPLTCILSAVETLTDDPAPAAIPQLHHILKLHAQRLNALVNDLLALAALEQQERAPLTHFQMVTLQDVIQTALELTHAAAVTAHIDVQVVAPEQPVTIQGDPRLLEQALLNLLHNAINYSQATTITITLSQADPEHISLTVKDNGIGIPPEHQTRIFERFYRVHKERSRERGGTGLGLAIVKHIALLHNATATLVSLPTPGTAFTLTFNL